MQSAMNQLVDQTKQIIIQLKYTVGVAIAKRSRRVVGAVGNAIKVQQTVKRIKCSFYFYGTKS